MLRSFPTTLAVAVAGASLGSGAMPSALAQGSLFTAIPVDLSSFVLVAAPIGSSSSSQLNIYEQRTSKRPCFAVEGAAPAVVNPLLATFDFTGICNRYIDGNGYSLRIGGDDFGTRYRLSVVKSKDDVKLLAVGAEGSHLVARSGGYGDGFIKLDFEPGWTLMRRQYGTRALGHLYVFRDAWPESEVEPDAEPEAEGQAAESEN